MDLFGFKRSSDALKKLKQLLEVGVSVGVALDTLIQDEAHKQTKIMYQKAKSGLEEGCGLLQVITVLLPLHTGVSFESLSQVGDSVLLVNKLSLYYEKKAHQVSDIVSQLSYPLVLLGSLLVLLWIFVSVLLPNMIGFFDSMDLTLPVFIKACFSSINFYNLHKWWFVLGTGSVCVLGYRAFRHAFAATLIYRLFPPSLGDLLWIFSMLLENGVSTKHALSCITYPPAHPFYKPLHIFKENFYKSGKFTASFNEGFVLRPLFKHVLLFAERSGNMGKTIRELSELIYEEDARKINLRLTIIQPVLIGVISVFVFCFMYITFIPVFESINHIQ